MYAKLKLTDSKGNLLKAHHHVRLNYSFLQDCQVWVKFLKNAGKIELCHPFRDFDPNIEYVSLNFASDASLNQDLGFGACYNDHWLVGQWDRNFIQKEKPSIEFLELFVLSVALKAWEDDKDLKNGRFSIYCDNQAVMFMINNLALSCMQCLKLIRFIALQCLRKNMRIRVKYVRSKDNVLPDALSRLDFKRFWKNALSTMDGMATHIPHSLWPIQKVWSESFDCWEV